MILIYLHAIVRNLGNLEIERRRSLGCLEFCHFGISRSRNLRLQIFFGLSNFPHFRIFQFYGYLEFLEFFYLGISNSRNLRLQIFSELPNFFKTSVFSNFHWYLEFFESCHFGISRSINPCVQVLRTFKFPKLPHFPILWISDFLDFKLHNKFCEMLLHLQIKFMWNEISRTNNLIGRL